MHTSLMAKSVSQPDTQPDPTLHQGGRILLFKIPGLPLLLLTKLELANAGAWFIGDDHHAAFFGLAAGSCNGLRYILLTSISEAKIRPSTTKSVEIVSEIV